MPLIASFLTTFLSENLRSYSTIKVQSLHLALILWYSDKHSEAVLPVTVTE